MKKPNIKVKITKEDSGYSANGTVHNIFINTEGDNFDELKIII